MKIDGVDPLKNNPQVAPPKAKPISGPSFSDVLQQATGTSVPPSTSVAGATGPVASTPFLMPIESANPSRDDIFKSLDGLMTDLDMLQNALGNEEVPLGRMEPLMNALVERKDDLSKIIERVDDPELRNLLTEALSLVIDQADQYRAGYTQA